MKTLEKKQAIALRKEGKSYNEIVRQIKVSKSTLNGWLENIQLTEEQKNNLSKRSINCGLRSGKLMRDKWTERRTEVKEKYKPPIENSEFMLGLGLYWGEGTKCSRSEVIMSNSDPRIILIFMKWIKDFFGCDGFTCIVHHHNPENDVNVLKYWSNKLSLDLKHFRKSQFAVSKSSQKKRNTLEYGTVHVRVRKSWKVRQKIEKAFEVIEMRL